jgi:hypothetical protein
MAADLLTISIDWYGPYQSLGDARRQGIASDLGEFLYLAYRTDGQSNSYVGLSSNVSSRLTSSHHVLGNWPVGSGQLWIGVIASQYEAGRKPFGSYSAHSGELHFAEHMTAYFVETSDNVRKRTNRPDRSGVLLNRWFRGAAPWKRHGHRPHPDWPDLIEYEANESLARIVWFGGRVSVLRDEQIAALRRDAS